MRAAYIVRVVNRVSQPHYTKHTMSRGDIWSSGMFSEMEGSVLFFYFFPYLYRYDMRNWGMRIGMRMQGYQTAWTFHGYDTLCPFY